MATKKKPRTKKTLATVQSGTDFGAAFAGLKQLLERHASALRVIADKPGNYALETISAVYRGKPVYVGGVQTRKNYVSFYFMPVYMNPPLLKTISPELRKRMQGKACFNFTAADEELFRELGRVVDAGVKQFREGKFAFGGATCK